MKHAFAKLTLISLSLVGSLLAAQAPSAPPSRPTAPAHRAFDPQKQLSHLTKKLALTGDQQSQILPILTDRQVQVNAVRSDTTLTQKQQRAKLMAVRSDSESKLRNVLTDTQRSAYDQMQQEARERARTRKETTTAVQ